MDAQLAHNLDKNRTQDVRLKDAAPFSNWLLKDNVKKGLQEAGFKMPTVIQASAIPVGKTGLDLLIQSKAGTGKTLIFCTILLENCLQAPGLSSLILAPTREIALQIENVLQRIARPCKNFKIISAIGGTDVVALRQQLQNANVVVGTPGRLVHLIESDMIKTCQIKFVVLDEADQLYNESHRKNLETILNATPVQRQILACSATFCNDLDMELAKVMRNPLLISTNEKIAILIGIKQFVLRLPEKKGSLLEIEAKVEAMLDIIKRVPFKLCMVFACSQSRAETYSSYLKKSDWHCELISGALPQPKRNEIFKKFNNFETRILVCTDLMARGIDSENVNLVINLEPPRDMVTYLHRIGRAGRFGSYGIAINVLCTEKDNNQFTKIITEIGTDFKIHEFPAASVEGEVDDFWEPSTFKEDLPEETVILRPKESNENNNKDANANTNEIEIEITKNEMETAIKLQKTKNDENIKILCSVEDSQLSINTNTFCIDSKDSAVNVLSSPLPENKENLLLCQPEDTPTSNRSSIQLSANTIDDASSIAADSQFSLRQERTSAPYTSLADSLSSQRRQRPSAPRPSLAFDDIFQRTIDEVRTKQKKLQRMVNDEFERFKREEPASSVEPSLQLYSNEEIISNYDGDVFLDYMQQNEIESDAENEDAMPESNETTIGEDFSNEKQNTSMQVCVDSIMPTEVEVKILEDTIAKSEVDNDKENQSNSEEHLIESQTDQTIDGTTNGSCNADSEPSTDMLNSNDEDQQKVSSAYYFNGYATKQIPDDIPAVAFTQFEKLSIKAMSAAVVNKADDKESEQSELEDEQENEQRNKINEIWINEYWKQVNFIQSYSKFMLDYSKNPKTE